MAERPTTDISARMKSSSKCVALGFDFSSGEAETDTAAVLPLVQSVNREVRAVDIDEEHLDVMRGS
jgi:hypothetical protein